MRISDWSSDVWSSDLQRSSTESVAGRDDAEPDDRVQSEERDQGDEPLYTSEPRLPAPTRPLPRQGRTAGEGGIAPGGYPCPMPRPPGAAGGPDRKSTRLNSSH